MEAAKILSPIKMLMGSVLLMLLLCTSGCATYIGYDGPYKGQVIDIDTNQPIEGAVVHATWNWIVFSLVGGTGSYYDSRETLTDKDGNFKLQGVGLQLLSNIEEAHIILLKAGYTQESDYWSSFTDKDFSGKRYYPNIDMDGDKLIFKLRWMSLEERRKRIVNTPNTPSNKEIKLFMKEENKENIEIGSPRNTLYPEELLK